MEIEVYARLRGNLDALDQSSAVMGTDILDVQDNVVAVGPEPRRVAVAFNAVLSDSASTEDVFECVASPLLWAFLDGQNAAMLVAGESGAGKTYTLAGVRASRGGLVAHVLSDLFTMLPPDAELSVQYCEISPVHGRSEHALKDLINPAHRCNRVLETAEDGVPVIEGLTRRPVNTAADAIALYRSGTAARTLEPAAKDDAALLFFLHLALGDVRSTFLVAKLPGAESLVANEAHARLTNDGRTHNAMREFESMVSQLSGRPAGSIHSQPGKLVALLTEALGGNCRTAVIFTLLDTVTPVTQRLLVLAAKLSNVVNFPVKNTLAARGLERRFRNVLLRLRTILEAQGWDSGVALVHENLDRLQERAQSEQLYTKLLETQQRQEEIVRERDSMAAQLQANEEEHLLVSKRLVDAQIEVIRAQEEADKKSFEQTTKILTLESELQQRTAQVAELTLQVDDLKTGLATAEKGLQREVTRNEELSLEVHTLTKHAVGQLQQQQRDNETSQQSKPIDMDNIQRRVDHMHSELSEKHAGLHLRIRALEEEKATLQEQLSEASQLKQKTVDDMQAKHEQALTTLRTTMEQASRVAESEAHQIQRHSDVMATELRANKEKLASAETEQTRMRQVHAKFVEEYRGKLRKYIQEAHDFMNRTRPASSVASDQHFKAYVGMLLKDLSSTYTRRESDLNDALSHATIRYQGLTRQYDELMSAYHSLHQHYREAGSPQHTSRDEQPTVMVGVPAAGLPTRASTANFEELRQHLRAFTVNTQSRLEQDRAQLLVRATAAEQKAKQMEEYVATNLLRYRKEIMRLRQLNSPAASNLPAPTRAQRISTTPISLASSIMATSQRPAVP